MTVFLSRISSICCQNLLRGSNYLKIASQNLTIKTTQNFAKNDIFKLQSSCLSRLASTQAAPAVMVDPEKVLMNKKAIHKKPNLVELSQKEGHYITLAYATADEYDLKALRTGLEEQKLYQPMTLRPNEMGDVVVASAVYETADEPREIIFFKEGAVVFWNCNEIEANNVLEFLKRYEIGSYPREVVEHEKEVMSYVYHEDSRCYLADSHFVLAADRDSSLERHTFSHGMAQSARLGALERRLEPLASSLSHTLRLMQTQGAANVEKKDIVRQLGELFSLRHQLNVESDLLDVPDLYWEQERLERLYSATVAYFTIPRRTRVLNSRLSHCVELLELLSTWAADRHHVRLELMIIALILVEVCFELLHFAERYLRDTSGTLLV